MESLIKTGVEILFALVTLFFVIYSIIAIYSLTTFGRSKSLTATLGFVYSVVVIGLVFWGLQTLTHIK
jgi:hypothetical protein